MNKCQHTDGQCFLCSPMRHPSTAAGRKRIARQNGSNSDSGGTK